MSTDKTTAEDSAAPLGYLADVFGPQRGPTTTARIKSQQRHLEKQLQDLHSGQGCNGRVLFEALSAGRPD